jgi:DNA-binding CsgD family transcriptional regulator
MTALLSPTSVFGCGGTTLNAYSLGFRQRSPSSMGADVPHARRELEELRSRATSGDEFGGVVSAAVRSLVPFDDWCLLGLDPENGLRTFQFGGPGVGCAEGNARNESLMSDVNKYADLALRALPIGWLSDEHPKAQTSYRMNEILRPQGVTSELRLVLRDADRAWGALVLFRDHPRRNFGDVEASHLAQITDVLASAIRRHPVRPGPRVEPLASGTALLSPTNTILSISPAAQEWLDDLVPGGDDQTWPEDVTRVMFDAANALRKGRLSASACIRTVGGRWLSVSATELPFREADVAVTLGAATAQQILDTCVRHHGLTAREAQVLSHAVSGLAAKQIARALGISTWTVSEHLTSVYRKFGVSGREELVGTLM